MGKKKSVNYKELVSIYELYPKHKQTQIRQREGKRIEQFRVICTEFGNFYSKYPFSLRSSSRLNMNMDLHSTFSLTLI